MLAMATIALGAVASGEQSSDILLNNGEMVYYEHFATPGGPGYQPNINGTDIRYDGTTSSKSLAERTSTWMQMNLYWDTSCNSDAATWEQNIESNFDAAYWGWNSYLGGVGMVDFPSTIDSFQAGGNIVFSTSECSCPSCMHNWYDTGYCESVGYTPNDLWVYTAACDAGGVENYAG
jgi:hypothetical protein